MRVVLEHMEKLFEQVYKNEYEEFKEVDTMLEGALPTYSEIRLMNAKAEGLEEGRELEHEELTKKNVRNMVKSNLTAEQISQYLDISLDEVHQILEEKL